jgi:hypothetical protein
MRTRNNLIKLTLTLTSWSNYIDQRWPLKDTQKDYQPDADYLKTRPTITPKVCEPLWWVSPVPEHQIADARRRVQYQMAEHPNDWHPGYVKPVIVRHGGGKAGLWVALDGFNAVHPQPKSKSHQQLWIIIRGIHRGRYCKGVQYIPENKAYTVHFLDYNGGRLYDSNAIEDKVSIEDLNIAWVDPRFKEEVKWLNFYVPQRNTIDVWSTQVDLLGNV